ncbi:alpha/beta fold hydrolase [Candidatus Bathyarchaeota archaeon]|nr:alpha/beta fold hydrolase [Candidatus Bathyarchaeota archaeon]
MDGAIEFSSNVPRFIPRTGIRRAMKIGHGIILGGIIAVMATGFTFLPTGISWAIFFVSLTVLVFHFLIIFGKSMVSLNERYETMDYSGLVKNSFTFTSKSDGLELPGYSYHREGLDRSAGQFPAIISFHGWGASHVEMDRYILPMVRENDIVYYTLDQRGSAPPFTGGDKNDHLNGIEDANQFLDLVIKQPDVDVERVLVVGMSMGSFLTLKVAYPDPRVKAVVVMAPPVDINLTLQEMPLGTKLGFKLFGFKLKITGMSPSELSPLACLERDGIPDGNGKRVPNKERVLMFHARDDRIVSFKNSEIAKDILALPSENVVFFDRGDHWLVGNETYITLIMSKFLTKHLA